METEDQVLAPKDHTVEAQALITQTTPAGDESESSSLSEEGGELATKTLQKNNDSKKLQTNSSERATYPTALAQGVIKIRNPLNQKTRTVNALGDNCATHLTLDDTTATEMGMDNPRHTFTVGGQGGYTHAYQAFKHELELLDQKENVIATTTVYCYPRPRR